MHLSYDDTRWHKKLTLAQEIDFDHYTEERFAYRIIKRNFHLTAHKILCITHDFQKYLKVLTLVLEQENNSEKFCLFQIYLIQLKDVWVSWIWMHTLPIMKT